MPRRGAQGVGADRPAAEEHAEIPELDRIAARRRFEEAEPLHRVDDRRATGTEGT